MHQPSSLPSFMRVVEISAPGGPEVLHLARRPLPSPGPEEVLIRVAAAGVNRPDVMQRKGLYPPPPGASDIPGLEVAGEVIATGARVAEWKPGDAVCALVTGGGYAEYCLAHALLCLPVPRGLNFTEAASLPETFFTVWSNLFDRARLQPGETLLVHGGSSGIGAAAIQLARAWGATVFVTAGTADKCRFCEQLGAMAAINYREEDFVERIRQLTENKGVDVILDMVGGDYLQRNLDSLAPDGRLVQIAVHHGPKTAINVLPILLKRLTLTGSTLRPRPVSFKAAIADKLRDKVWPALESGVIRPVVFRTFPLENAPEAHQLMEESGHVGKIVLIL